MPYSTELIPCAQCGIPRPLQVRSASHRKVVQQRICTRCNTTNIRAYNVSDPGDVDEMAVERLIAGTPVQARPSERMQAVAYLTRRRLSAKQIAERIGCTKRTVERHR
jgi:DNA-binding NarL/FixJ family response regulator